MRPRGAAHTQVARLFPLPMHKPAQTRPAQTRPCMAPASGGVLLDVHTVSHQLQVQASHRPTHADPNIMGPTCACAQRLRVRACGAVGAPEAQRAPGAAEEPARRWRVGQQARGWRGAARAGGADQQVRTLLKAALVQHRRQLHHLQVTPNPIYHAPSF